MTRAAGGAVLMALVLVIGPRVAAAQPAPAPGAAAAETACHVSRFAGEVSHGQAFERALGGDLVFRLAPAGHPANPPGWTIEVRHTGMPGPENELSWVVTPPYRVWNPRYLDTGYGWTARQAVETSPREFAFVTTPIEYRSAAAAARTLHWPAGVGEAELAAARRAFAAVRRATGRLDILHARVDEQATGGRGRIEWLRFQVEVCLPGP